MTIQEYIRIAVKGYPKNEFHYYEPYFIKMDCEHCIYNGYACKSPKKDDVCIDYRVEKSHKEFKIKTNKKDVSTWEESKRNIR